MIPADETGDYEVQVVGESRHQDRLERICGGRTEDGACHDCTAHLIPEDANQYDDEAVRVDVEGAGTVGYLAKPDARRYRKRYGATVSSCPAQIVGGWERDDDRGHFGINLDVDL